MRKQINKKNKLSKSTKSWIMLFSFAALLILLVVAIYCAVAKVDIIGWFQTKWVWYAVYAVGIWCVIAFVIWLKDKTEG